MNFDPMGFVNNLQYMGIGMLGVFMIVGIIIAATYAIGFFRNLYSSNDDNK